MPTDAHEAVLAPLTYACTKAIYEMGHDNAVVQVHVGGNTRFIGDHITGDPDMHIRVSSTLPHTSSEFKSLMTTEVGFTQGEIPVIRKLNNYTIDSQYLESASSFLVSERKPYSCPANNSEIARRLQSSPLKSYDEWKPKRTKKNAFGPVIVEGHTWIDISKVDIHAWVRTSPTANIDVNQRNSGYAYGSLHPEYRVDDVDKLFGIALKKISEKILSCYEEHMEGARRARGASSGFAEDGDQEVVEEPEPDVELSDLSSISDSDEEIDEAPDEDQLAVTIASLSNWQPTLPVVDWRELKNTLITGIWNTAYSRYRSWHERLKKRDVQEAFDDQEYHNERRRDERHHDEEPRMTRSMTKRLRPNV
ncbi:hypothetical protein BD769DRAFT_1674790 [Suillus cothurnatus]|nr:hypothetical protein BD769DRAFT_1674790 [Suillus cothurnatus]